MFKKYVSRIALDMDLPCQSWEDESYICVFRLCQASPRKAVCQNKADGSVGTILQNVICQNSGLRECCMNGTSRMMSCQTQMRSPKPLRTCVLRRVGCAWRTFVPPRPLGRTLMSSCHALALAGPGTASRSRRSSRPLTICGIFVLCL